MKKRLALVAILLLSAYIIGGCVKGADQQRPPAEPVMATSVSENEPKTEPVLWPSWKLPDEITEFTEGRLESVFSGERYALLTFSGVSPEEFKAFEADLSGVSFYFEEEEAYLLAKIGLYTLRVYFFSDLGVMQLHSYEEKLFSEWEDLGLFGVPKAILAAVNPGDCLPYGAEYKKIWANPKEHITEHFELFYQCLFTRENQAADYLNALLQKGWSGGYPRVSINMEIGEETYRVSLEYLGAEEGLAKFYCRYEKKSG